MKTATKTEISPTKPAGDPADAPKGEGSRPTSGTKKFSEAQRERTARAYWLTDGNAEATARQLREEGVAVTAATVRDWAERSYKDLFMQVRLEMVPHLRRARIKAYRRLADEHYGFKPKKRARRVKLSDLERGES